jgi:single-stranded DNA-binding protein
MMGRKGDVVSLKGRIEYRKWEDKYYTDIIVDHLHLAKKKGKPDDDGFVEE